MSFHQRKRSRRGLQTGQSQSSAAVGIESDAEFARALALFRAGSFGEAEALAAILTERSPGSPECWNLRATILAKLGRNADAGICFGVALDLAPKSAAVLCNLSQFQRATGQLDAALKHAKRAARCDPNSAVAFNTIGTIETALGQEKKASFAFKKALRLDPRFADAHANLGNIYRAFGDKEKAKRSYHKALTVDRSSLDVHYNLALVSDYREDRAHLDELLLLDAETEEGARKLPLHFALANALDQRGMHKEAYHHFSKGNALGAKMFQFNLDRERGFQSRVARMAEDASGRTGPAPDLPMQVIFVIGMPRSGTTLIEQILSAHPEVTALGELDVMDREMRKFQVDEGSLSSQTAFQALIDKIRQSYEDKWSRRAEGARFIVDKMPFNFRWLGVIQQAFPDAAIVNLMRDPSAVCWSNFRHRFSSSNAHYSWKMDDIFAFYGFYCGCLHAHNPGMGRPILNVEYHDLVMHSRPEVERLHEHCGLQASDAYFEKPQQTRAIQTASSNQVRQGIYQGSSLKWQSYRQWLDRDFAFTERSAELKQRQNSVRFATSCR